MNWSPAQRQLLEAMGYTPLRRAGAPAGTAPGDASARPEPAPAGDSAKLLQALRRAARGRDLDAVLPGDLSGLRDPVAKRALWSRLRALRRH